MHCSWPGAIAVRGPSADIVEVVHVDVVGLFGPPGRFWVSPKVGRTSSERVRTKTVGTWPCYGQVAHNQWRSALPRGGCALALEEERLAKLLDLHCASTAAVKRDGVETGVS